MSSVSSVVGRLILLDAFRYAADVIKTIVKLAFVALLANAAWQVFNVYWAHFKFNDAVQQTTQFRGDKTDAQLRARRIRAR